MYFIDEHTKAWVVVKEGFLELVIFKPAWREGASPETIKENSSDEELIP